MLTCITKILRSEATWKQMQLQTAQKKITFLHIASVEQEMTPSGVDHVRKGWPQAEIDPGLLMGGGEPQMPTSMNLQILLTYQWLKYWLFGNGSTISGLMLLSIWLQFYLMLSYCYHRMLHSRECSSSIDFLTPSTLIFSPVCPYIITKLCLSVLYTNLPSFIDRYLSNL